MRNAETRKKVSRTLMLIGHQPPVQGGNGRQAPLPQRMLASELGWPMEYSIKTGRKPGDGAYPTCYKLDLALPQQMIGIEVDGRSHCLLERRRQDAKKDRFLASIGWTVLRFTNQQVLEDLDGCLAQVKSLMSTTSK